ncbi:hypothetical protein EGW08_008763, partial [Elysia chlorotica]
PFCPILFSRSVQCSDVRHWPVREKTIRVRHCLATMSSVDEQAYDARRLKVVAKAHMRNMKKQNSLASVSTARDSGSRKDIRVYRDSLPALMVNKNEISVWSILKSCIGK